MKIWTDPTSRRERSMITLTALVAHGHYDELAMHVRAARRNGLTPEEIGAEPPQMAVYCGVPAANSASLRLSGCSPRKRATTRQAAPARPLRTPRPRARPGGYLSPLPVARTSSALAASPSAPHERASVRPLPSSETERAAMPYSTPAAACSYWQGEASR